MPPGRVDQWCTQTQGQGKASRRSTGTHAAGRRADPGARAHATRVRDGPRFRLGSGTGYVTAGEVLRRHVLTYPISVGPPWRPPRRLDAYGRPCAASQGERRRMGRVMRGGSFGGGPPPSVTGPRPSSSQRIPSRRRCLADGRIHPSIDRSISVGLFWILARPPRNVLIFAEICHSRAHSIVSGDGSCAAAGARCCSSVRTVCRLQQQHGCTVGPVSFG